MILAWIISPPKNLRLQEMSPCYLNPIDVIYSPDNGPGAV